MIYQKKNSIRKYYEKGNIWTFFFPNRDIVANWSHDESLVKISISYVRYLIIRTLQISTDNLALTKVVQIQKTRLRNDHLIDWHDYVVDDIFDRKSPSDAIFDDDTLLLMNNLSVLSACYICFVVPCFDLLDSHLIYHVKLNQ